MLKKSLVFSIGYKITPFWIEYFTLTVDKHIQNGYIDHMKLRYELVNNWIGRNNPNGLYKLAHKSELSTGLIDKVRRGHVPKPNTIKKLCDALEIKESDFVLNSEESA